MTAAQRRYARARADGEPGGQPPPLRPLAKTNPDRDLRRQFEDSAGPRLRAIRPRTLAARRLSRAQVEEILAKVPKVRHPRPRTRAECQDGPRPCPYVGCKFHLYIDVNPDNGSIKLNFPDREPGDLEESCVLDVAERGGLEQTRIAELLNVTTTRVQQLEYNAVLALRGPRLARIHKEFADQRRHLPVIHALAEIEEANE